MGAERALLSALAADPGDHGIRLALADALEEAGRAGEAEVARLHARQLMRVGSPEELARLCALLEGGVRPVVPEVVNSIGMRLALIPPGAFLMGSPEDEAERKKGEGPQHEVRITQAYYLGVFPVTQAEYKKVTGTSPSHYAAGGERGDKVAGLDTSRFPVENVRWEEGVAFCEALTGRERKKGAIGEKQEYRLPTEAEWEYACRAGAAHYQAFHFGDRPGLAQVNHFGGYAFGDPEWGQGVGRPTSVGSYPPNAPGLYDMHGNVWEWCRDKHGEDTYQVGPYPRVDPAGPRKGRERDRVFRGGSFAYHSMYSRSAYRGRSPDVWDDIKGIRTCLTWAAPKRPARGGRTKPVKE